jgi:hypothetical protein
MAKATIEAYEASTPRAAKKAFEHTAKEWRAAAEALLRGSRG